jgi:hypothetical protein
LRLTLSSLAQVEMLSAIVVAQRDHASRPPTLPRVKRRGTNSRHRCGKFDAYVAGEPPDYMYM